jgi:PPM family protein phosphatase
VIRLDAGSASLVGRVRSANEDALAVTEDLVVVADGMGGHLAGEVASADAVEVVADASGRPSLAELVAAVHRANRRINQRAADDDELRGMGTTVCAVGLVDEDGERLAVLNVGDSRVYLLADGTLTRLTEDHSLVETLVREGRISPEDAEVHPQRNVLTRALGVDASVVVDAWLLDPCDGDRLLLCSDGLFNELSEARINEILSEERDPQTCASRLADEADAAGGRDNISTVVVDVRGAGRGPEPLGDRYRRIATPTGGLDDDEPRDAANDTATVPLVPVAAAPSPDLVEDPGAVADPLDESGDSSGAAADLAAEVDDDPVASEDAAEPGEGPGPLDDSAAVGNGLADSRWRTPLFVLAILLVVSMAAAAVVLNARRGWFVGASEDKVAIYRGQPQKFLWIEASVDEQFELELSELRPNQRSDVQRRRRQFDDRVDAEKHVQRLRDSVTTTTTTTTTTTSTTTTTTSTTTTTAPLPPPPDGPAPGPPPPP